MLRTNYSRRPSPPRPPPIPKKLEPPSLDLIIFNADGENYTAAKDALAKHCLKSYGRVANFIVTGTELIRKKPVIADVLRLYPLEEGYTKELQQKIVMDEINDYRKKLDEDKTAYAKMFGTFMQVLVEESEERTKSAPAYKQAEKSLHAPDLLKIMDTVITTNSSDATREEAKYDAFQRHASNIQVEGQSLTSYFTQENQRYLVLRNMEHPQLPDEPTRVRRLLHGLYAPLYGEFIAFLLNEERIRSTSFPKTIPKLLDLVRAFIPSIAYEKYRTPHTVAYGTAIADRDCWCCGEVGHIAKNCPRKASPRGAAPVTPERQTDQITAASSQPSGGDVASATPSTPTEGDKPRGKKKYSLRAFQARLDEQERVERLFDNLFLSV